MCQIFVVRARLYLDLRAERRASNAIGKPAKKAWAMKAARKVCQANELITGKSSDEKTRNLRPFAKRQSGCLLLDAVK